MRNRIDCDNGVKLYTRGFIEKVWNSGTRTRIGIEIERVEMFVDVYVVIK